MAGVVLIHGIGQQHTAPDVLESQYLPALAGGMRLAGFTDAADALWRDSRPGSCEARVAFYGDVFRGSDRQGDADELTEAQLPVMRRLLVEIAEHAAETAQAPDDVRATEQALALVDVDRPDQQGVGAALRPVINALVRVRPLATLGMDFAGTVLRTTLVQVSRYLTDDEVRAEVQRRVAALVDTDTKVIIGHSLGSVVAYEAAHRLGRPLPLLVTLGSPLGLRNIVYDLLQPQPPSVPPLVRRWTNVADRDDLVAARLDLDRHFPGADGVLHSTYTVDNGAHPHDATFYLTAREVGRHVGQALQTGLC